MSTIYCTKEFTVCTNFPKFDIEENSSTSAFSKTYPRQNVVYIVDIRSAQKQRQNFFVKTTDVFAPTGMKEIPWQGDEPLRNSCAVCCTSICSGNLPLSEFFLYLALPFQCFLTVPVIFKCHDESDSTKLENTTCICDRIREVNSRLHNKRQMRICTT